MRPKLIHEDPVVEAVQKVLTVASATKAALNTAEAKGAFDGKLRRRVYALQKCMLGDAVFEQGDPEGMRRFAGLLEEDAGDECSNVFIPDQYHARGGGWQVFQTPRGIALRTVGKNLTDLADALDYVQALLRAESFAAALRR